MKSGRKHKETGGANEAEEDLKDKPEARTDAKEIDHEAEEMKKGGRAKRKRGGRSERKEGGKIEGEKGAMHAGRKPRKSGGRTGADADPWTTARKGKDAPGRSLMKGEAGFGED
jgi:hypothetical protein